MSLKIMKEAEMSKGDLVEVDVLEPTNYGTFDTADDARKYLREHGSPGNYQIVKIHDRIVVKEQRQMSVERLEIEMPKA